MNFSIYEYYTVRTLSVRTSVLRTLSCELYPYEHYPYERWSANLYTYIRWRFLVISNYNLHITPRPRDAVYEHLYGYIQYLLKAVILLTFWLLKFVSWHFYPFDFVFFWLFVLTFILLTFPFCPWLFWLLTLGLLTLCPFDLHLSTFIRFDCWAVGLLPFWLLIFGLIVRFGFLSIDFSLSWQLPVDL